MWTTALVITIHGLNSNYERTWIATLEIKVNKEWSDNEIQAQRRPEEITFKVKNGNNEVQEHTLNTASEREYTFTNLPKYNDNGEEIEYSVDEEFNSKFYSKPDSIIVSDVENETDKKQATVTNTFTKPDDTITLTVQKEWQRDIASVRPENLTINIKGVVDGNDVANLSKAIVMETSSSNIWSKQVSVDKYDENGREITYEFEIETSTNTIKLAAYPENERIVENSENKIKVINKYKTTSVTVKKEWINPSKSELPTSIDVQLYKNGNAPGVVAIKDDVPTNAKFVSLTAVDKNGNSLEDQISLAKLKSEEGYSVTVQQIQQCLENLKLMILTMDGQHCVYLNTLEAEKRCCLRSQRKTNTLGDNEFKEKLLKILDCGAIEFINTIDQLRSNFHVKKLSISGYQDELLKNHYSNTNINMPK